MNIDFPNQIYAEAKRLFPEDSVQTLVACPVGPGATEAFDPAVRLVHTQTGLEITCDKYPSQTENFIAAAFRLRVACDKRLV